MRRIARTTALERLALEGRPSKPEEEVVHQAEVIVPNRTRIADLDLGSGARAVSFELELAPAAPPRRRASERPRRSSRPPNGQRAFDIAVEDAEEAFKAQKWDGLEPRVFLGLYAMLHEKVYGVLPAELAEEWHPALRKVTAFLEKDFGGDREELAEFMRWSWGRTKRRRSRTSPDEDDFRMGWRYQFGKKLLVDYRAAMNR